MYAVCSEEVNTAESQFDVIDRLFDMIDHLSLLDTCLLQGHVKARGRSCTQIFDSVRASKYTSEIGYVW